MSVMKCSFYILFFFSSRRRHTRWPRDWSSDVCSSDLAANAPTATGEPLTVRSGTSQYPETLKTERTARTWAIDGVLDERSEERRVGKECRARWSAKD